MNYVKTVVFNTYIVYMYWREQKDILKLLKETWGYEEFALEIHDTNIFQVCYICTEWQGSVILELRQLESTSGESTVYCIIYMCINSKCINTLFFLNKQTTHTPLFWLNANIRIFLVIQKQLLLKI